MALAAESRAVDACGLCTQRKQALSPYHLTGDHHQVTDLPSERIDVVHRMASDPTRLTREWLEGVLQSSVVTDGEYVEMVAVLARIRILDVLAEALGVSAPDLPGPRSGEPTRVQPRGAKVRNTWILTVSPADAGEELAWLYEGVDQVATVEEALTLAPADAIAFRRLVGALYLKPDEPAHAARTRGSLTRPQVELLASRVSALNDCFY